MTANLSEMSKQEKLNMLVVPDVVDNTGFLDAATNAATGTSIGGNGLLDQAAGAANNAAGGNGLLDQAAGAANNASKDKGWLAKGVDAANGAANSGKTKSKKGKSWLQKGIDAGNKQGKKAGLGGLGL